MWQQYCVVKGEDRDSYGDMGLGLAWQVREALNLQDGDDNGSSHLTRAYSKPGMEPRHSHAPYNPLSWVSGSEWSGGLRSNPSSSAF